MKYKVNVLERTMQRGNESNDGMEDVLKSLEAMKPMSSM